MSARRFGWRAVLAGFSLMVLGAVAGIAADRFIQHTHEGIAAELRELHDDPMRVLDQTMELTPEQRPRIHAILQAHQAAADSIWHAARQQLDATIDSVLLEIDTLLDPAQSTRFHEAVERLHGRPFPTHQAATISPDTGRD